MGTRPNRRAVLLGLAIGAGLAGCGSGEQRARTGDVAKGSRQSSTFRSAARKGIEVSYDLILPPGHQSVAGLPVCLVLHGMGDDHRAGVRFLHLDVALAAITGGGAPPFALVGVDGGRDTYWHRRADGDDPQAMVLDELLPRLTAAGAVTPRFALFGWSMGAYGSLLLAETVGRQRVAFVAADSPALWLQPGLSAPGAFDDAADFVRHDVFAGRPRLAGIPVRVMCGRSDPFAAATREFVKGVPDLVAADFPVGGHDRGLWAATAVAQLTPVAHALA